MNGLLDCKVRFLRIARPINLYRIWKQCHIGDTSKCYSLLFSSVLNIVSVFNSLDRSAKKSCFSTWDICHRSSISMVFLAKILYTLGRVQCSSSANFVTVMLLLRSVLYMCWPMCIIGLAWCFARFPKHLARRLVFKIEQTEKCGNHSGTCSHLRPSHAHYRKQATSKAHTDRYIQLITTIASQSWQWDEYTSSGRFYVAIVFP